MFPFVSAEIPDFDLQRALNNGMLPRHYLVADPSKRIQAYIGDYLQQEIVEEAIVRQLDAFTRFLHFVSYTFGEDKILSYWRTLDNKYEVDVLICDALTNRVEVAIEIKSADHVVSNDTKGLKAFGEEHPDTKLILLSMEERPRLLNGIEIWPVIDFLAKLWNRKWL